MATEPRPDIETLVAAWRERLTAAGIWPSEIEELEAHVRDRMEDLVGRGATHNEAFERAVADVGPLGELAAHLRKARRPRDTRGRVMDFLDSLSGGLLLNYSRVVFRTLRRDRGFAVISVLGLGVGVALCLLLLSYVRFELRYDDLHTRSDRIVRVAKGGRATTPGLWGPELATTFIEVQEAVRIMDNQFARAVFRIDDRTLATGPGLVADPGFFDVFSWTLRSGSPENALTEPGSVVLSPQVAEAVFGSSNPMGQRMLLSGAGDFPSEVELTVTGILEPTEEPSHLRFGFVVSMVTVDALDRAGDWGTPFSWTNAFVKTYLLLQPNADPERLLAQFPGFIEARVSNDRYIRDDVFLQPLESIHLKSRLRFDPPGSGGIQLVYLLAGLSALVLAIACANFINLAIARSMQRARELGMRKALGAVRGQLILQFLGEALAISFLATLVAVPLVAAARPTFESITGRPLPLEAVLAPWSAGVLLLLAVITGLLAGWYPALLLSRFQPIRTLKSTGLRMGRRASARFLVIAQFAASIGLIAGSLILANQMSFVASKDLGFPHQDLLVVPIGQSESISATASDFAIRLERRPGVQAVGSTHSIPTSFLNEFSYLPEGGSVEDRVSLGSLSIGSGFFETLQPQILAGRALDANSPQDSSGFVVNRAALTRLGASSPQDAIARRLEWLLPGLGFSGTIVGVVEDFHYGSLREDIPPIAFHISRFGVNYLIVRPSQGQLSTAVESVRAAWSEVESAHPFQFELLSERVGGQYEQDRRLARLFSISAGIAVMLACLGLFGLMAFLAEQRRLELGVRKVLGASTASLLLLFVREAAQWIAFALLVATPLAWLAASRWLEGFAYHVSPGPVPYVVAGAAALAVALLAVSAQTIRVARAHPTVSLRSE